VQVSKQRWAGIPICKYYFCKISLHLSWYLFRKRIFELLGFEEDIANADMTLKPPSIDSSTPQGKQNRRKLLRAWIELGSWISDFKRVNGKQLTIGIRYSYVSFNQCGILESGRSTNCMCNWIAREKCTKLPLVPTLIKVGICVDRRVLY
jgi:hypothetical protein